MPSIPEPTREEQLAEVIADFAQRVATLENDAQNFQRKYAHTISRHHQLRMCYVDPTHAKRNELA